MTRTITLLMFTGLFTACSYIPSLDEVMPDNRSNYPKSEPLPDLEVPPDLTAGATTDAMTIPGEEGASLADYQRRTGQRGRRGPAPDEVAAVSADEQWVAVPGSKTDIWPRLEAFLREEGYQLDLSDRELGVMETAWSDAATESDGVYRDKFKIFTEPGAEPGRTVLFIANERQKQIGEGDSAGWSNQGGSNRAERLLAAELNRHFNGSSTTRVAAASGAGASASSMAERKLAELQDAGDNKLLLALPEEFASAWRNTERVLERAGFAIDDKDEDQGHYYITYFDNSADNDGGLLSTLAFWSDDGAKGVPYVVSLKGAGERTELTVLNEKGDWEASEDAGQILRIIRNEYNRL